MNHTVYPALCVILWEGCCRFYRKGKGLFVCHYIERGAAGVCATVERGATGVGVYDKSFFSITIIFR